MSWSIGATFKSNDVQEGLRQLTALAKTNPGNQQCPEERDQQMNVAIGEVFNLIGNSGMVDHADEITVALSGHANKEHDKDDSWANEFISVNVYVKSYRPKAE